MSNRETITFDSNGHTIVAYPFITNPEAAEAKKALFAGVMMEVPDPGMIAEKPQIPMANSMAYQRAQLEKCLVTVDGLPPFEVLDVIPSDEYDAITADIRTNLPKIFLVKAKTPDTPSQSSTA